VRYIIWIETEQIDDEGDGLADGEAAEPIKLASFDTPEEMLEYLRSMVLLLHPVDGGEIVAMSDEAETAMGRWAPLV